MEELKAVDTDIKVPENVQNVALYKAIVANVPRLLIEQVYSGMGVFIVGLDMPTALGEVHERVLEVTNIDLTNARCRVHHIIPKLSPPDYIPVKNLINHASLIDFISVHGDKYPTPPSQFKVDDIVFVKPSSEQPPSASYPSVNSKYETDLKILQVYARENKLNYSYKCYSPIAGTIHLSARDLITGRDKLKYKYKDYREGIVGEAGLLPFFSAGESVRIFNGEVHNYASTVIVPETKELLENLHIK